MSLCHKTTFRATYDNSADGANDKWTKPGGPANLGGHRLAELAPGDKPSEGLIELPVM
jgi:hypothetical protein